MIDVEGISTLRGEGPRALWSPQQYQNSTSWSAPERSARGPNSAAFAQGLIGFVAALLMYCCILHYLCDRYDEVTKKEVDRNIIKKVRGNIMYALTI